MQDDGGRMDVDQEDLDDQETLNLSEMMKSSIYRFLRKLEKYYVACRIITSELVSLIHSGADLNVKVESVPVSTAITTPALQNEYSSYEDFSTQRARVDVSTLDPQKVNSLRDLWPQRWRSDTLFLHPEMQIVLFYDFNRHLCPIQNFIGLSRKCCWCCDFILK
jgi:hypothetical protein